MTDASGTPRVPERRVAVDSRTPSPSKARRRFILAAGAALPSIYTLSSGAQTAVASNLSCWAREPQPPPPRFQPNEDNWLRGQVYTGDYEGAQAFCVSSPQADCVGRPMGWRVDPNTPAHEDSAREGSIWIARGSRVTAGPSVQITGVGERPRQYGLVYVDRAGTISTLDRRWSGDDLHVVSQSCWTSILGGRVSKLG